MSLKSLKLHWKPNQYLVAPEGYTESKPHLASPVYPVTAEALKQAFREVIEAAPRTKIDSDEGTLLKANQRTAVLRFKDLITAEFLPAGDGDAQLAIYSRSILGIRDFGVNKARITEWLAALDKKIAPKG